MNKCLLTPIACVLHTAVLPTLVTCLSKYILLFRYPNWSHLGSSGTQFLCPYLRYGKLTLNMQLGVDAGFDIYQ